MKSQHVKGMKYPYLCLCNMPLKGPISYISNTNLLSGDFCKINVCNFTGAESNAQTIIKELSISFNKSFYTQCLALGCMYIL